MAINETVLKTLMSQYANSPRIVGILSELGDAIDPSLFVGEFYDAIFNLHTARGFGLDIWGRIVNVGRTMFYQNPQGEFFGFEDGFYPMSQRPFSGAGNENNAWDLSDDAYRDLIFIKAFSNIVYATALNINRLLKFIFSGKCYFLIKGHMRAEYVFEFTLSPFERHIAFDTDILPRPCGVLTSIYELDINETFGFYGTGLQPMSQGAFSA